MSKESVNEHIRMEFWEFYLVRLSLACSECVLAPTMWDSTWFFHPLKSRWEEGGTSSTESVFSNLLKRDNFWET